MYGVLLLPVWIVFIVQGITLLAVSYATTHVFSDICDGTNEMESSVVSLLQGYQQDIDQVISPITDENMCRSNVCPCAATDSAHWLSLNQSTLSQYQRTTNESDLDDDDGSIQLHFNENTQQFLTFQECQL